MTSQWHSEFIHIVNSYAASWKNKWCFCMLSITLSAFPKYIYTQLYHKVNNVWNLFRTKSIFSHINPGEFEWHHCGFSNLLFTNLIEKVTWILWKLFIFLIYLFRICFVEGPLHVFRWFLYYSQAMCIAKPKTLYSLKKKMPLISV